MTSTPEAATAAERAQRTAPELAVLLLELARIVKARRFYGAGDAQLADVFGRALRAWRADLSRTGPLTLRVHEAGFSELGGGGLLHHARLEELLRDLRARDVETVTFDADMDGDALAGFADLLASQPPGSAEPGEAFAARLARVVPVGISVRLRAADAATAAVAPPAARETPAAAPPAAVATPAAPAPEVARPPAPPPPPQRQPAPASATAPAASPDADTLPMDPSDELSQLDLQLAELEACDASDEYLDLARRAQIEAERTREDAALFRVLDRFASDVESKRDRVKAVAESFLQTLAVGAGLAGLLERVARGEGGEQVRAAQILALAGDAIVAPVLDRLPAFPERVRRERLVPAVLTLGERAVPELRRRLELPDREASRNAALLLGMLQHPAAIPRLGELALEADLALREEAGKALVRIGSDEAVAALARGLRGRTPEVAIAAAHQLATTASALAVAPLGEALERALHAKDVNLAKELLRALGRLGRPEANEIFAGVMRRKSGLGHRWMRDVKVAAASALATVPGDQAVALLAEALHTRDEGLRRAAQRALDRRAESATRGAPGTLRSQ